MWYLLCSSLDSVSSGTSKQALGALVGMVMEQALTADRIVQVNHNTPTNKSHVKDPGKQDRSHTRASTVMARAQPVAFRKGSNHKQTTNN